MDQPKPDVFPNYTITPEQMRLVGAALSLAWQIINCDDEASSALIAAAKYITEKDTELFGAATKPKEGA